VHRLLKSPWARVAAAQVVAMLFLQAVNLAVAVPRPNGADPSGYYAWAQSWLEDGDSDPGNQLTVGMMFPVIEINGRSTIVDRYPIGWSAAVFPFMALARELVGTRRDGGTHAGLDPLVVRMAWIGVYLWALLGVLAAYDSLRRLLGLRAAVLGTVAAWLGTSAFAYTWKSPGMAHSITLATISLSFWCAVRTRGSRHPQAWALLWGLFASLTVCARVIDGLILVPSFLLLLLSLESPDEEQSPPQAWLKQRILTSSVCALAGFLPLTFFQMSIWHALYDQWFFNGYSATGYRFSPNLQHLALSLFSPNKGLVLWHPMVLLALGGLGLAAISKMRDRSIQLPSAVSIAIVLVMIALYGSWSAWNLGDGYGARWTADLFWIWAFGLALLFARTERTLSPAVITAVLFALVSTGLIGAQIIGRIPLH
jgi:hypothetical protein